MRDGERCVAGQFFGEDGGGDFVEARAAVFFGNRAAEQADFAGLLQHLRHQVLLCALRVPGSLGTTSFLNKFLGRLADQALVVGKIRGSKDVFGTVDVMRNDPPRLRACETGAVAMMCLAS